MGHGNWRSSSSHTNLCFTTSRPSLFKEPFSCCLSSEQARIHRWWSHLHLALKQGDLSLLFSYKINFDMKTSFAKNECPHFLYFLLQCNIYLNFQPQAPVRNYPIESVRSLCCTIDGSFLAGGTLSGNAYVWEVIDRRRHCIGKNLKFSSHCLALPKSYYFLKNSFN